MLFTFHMQKPGQISSAPKSLLPSVTCVTSMTKLSKWWCFKFFFPTLPGRRIYFISCQLVMNSFTFDVTFIDKNVNNERVYLVFFAIYCFRFFIQTLLLHVLRHGSFLGMNEVLEFLKWVFWAVERLLAYKYIYI